MDINESKFISISLLNRYNLRRNYAKLLKFINFFFNIQRNFVLIIFLFFILLFIYFIFCYSNLNSKNNDIILTTQNGHKVK